MDNLIFDRLSSDVDNALNNANSKQYQKGSYNITDLNRVEQWCEYIKNILLEYGKKAQLEIKKDWNFRNYPTRNQIDRIRNNIDILKNLCYSIKTQEIIYNNTLDFEQANTLEKILYDIDNYINENNREIYLNKEIGTTIVRTNYCSFLVDTHKRYYEYKTFIKSAGFVSKVKYIELKGEY